MAVTPHSTLLEYSLNALSLIFISLHDCLRGVRTHAPEVFPLAGLLIL